MPQRSLAKITRIFVPRQAALGRCGGQLGWGRPGARQSWYWWNQIRFESCPNEKSSNIFRVFFSIFVMFGRGWIGRYLFDKTQFIPNFWSMYRFNSHRTFKSLFFSGRNQGRVHSIATLFQIKNLITCRFLNFLAQNYSLGPQIIHLWPEPLWWLSPWKMI